MGAQPLPHGATGSHPARGSRRVAERDGDAVPGSAGTEGDSPGTSRFGRHAMPAAARGAGPDRWGPGLRTGDRSPGDGGHAEVVRRRFKFEGSFRVSVSVKTDFETVIDTCL